MAYLKDSLLREKANRFQKTASASFRYFTKNADQAEVTVFLSHSHKDKELVEGLIELLAEQGIYIYVDWNDTNMPRITSGETARKIKERIKELKLFFFLATQNGLNSKWCPWELGVADSVKSLGHILIIPVADPYGQFKGNEYLQIYKHLEISFNIFDIDSLEKPYVVGPGFIKAGEELLLESTIERHGGVPLKDFLLKI